MKQLIVIAIISLLAGSCARREIARLYKKIDTLTQQCDSLEHLLNDSRHYYFTHHNHSDTLRYYIIGHIDKLMQKGVIAKVSGLSREYKPHHNLSATHFKEDKHHMIDSLEVKGKNPRIVGCFNSSYYKLKQTSNDNQYTFIITNREKFWQFSSHLIIIHN